MGTLYEGAKNAVEVCMGIKRDEHTLIITDISSYEIGNALQKVAKKLTPYTRLFVLENYGRRPLTKLPEDIKSSIPWADVSFYVVESVKGEMGMRDKFLKKIAKYARHAHMPNITKQIMEQGMCSNHSEISRFTHMLHDTIIKNESIKVKNQNGTDLNIMLNPKWKWWISDGILMKRGEWGNLPGGELFTAPMKVDGTITSTLLGDYFSKNYGILKTPLKIEIKNSRANLENIEAETELKKDLIKYLQTDKNSNRCGEFSFPTNIPLLSKPLIGNLLQDEKARVHLAFGDPYKKKTGAGWESKTHVDMIIENCDVWIDKRKIMENNKYLLQF